MDGLEFFPQKDDLEEDAAGEIVTGLGIDHLENFKLEHQILDIPQRDLGARLGIVQTAIGVFLDQANWLGHAATLKRSLCAAQHYS